MMLALTYQQDPKKLNNTIRLKRISQRFSPGFKHIRLLKEDYLGRFTSKLAYKKNVQLVKRPISFRVPHIKPYKKWRSMIPRSAKRSALVSSGSVRGSWDNMKQRFVVSQIQLGVGNTNFSSFDYKFKLRDARQLPSPKKTSNLAHFRLFTACFQQFHMPYYFVRTKMTNILMGRRAAYIHAMRYKETSLRRSLVRLNWEISKIRKSLNSLPNNKTFSKARSLCFKDITLRQREFAKIKKELRLFLRTVRYKNGTDSFATQIPLFNFGTLNNHTDFPNKLTRFPQSPIAIYKGFGPSVPRTFENLQKFIQRRLHALPFPYPLFGYLRLRKLKKKLEHIALRRKAKRYKTPFSVEKLLKNTFSSLQNTTKSLSFSKKAHYYNSVRKRAYSKISAFNMFNFNTRSNQVLYRYMENVKRKFGMYYFDIPFRVDNYRKAYQKVRRPSKYKKMCIARNKIRLFYGQLSVTKMGRVLRKAPPSFPHMFGLMERRLDVLLVRSNFCKNIFTAQYIVRSGKILVNNRIHRNCFYAVKCFDFVTFKSKEFEMFCKYIILTKLRLNRLKYNFVPYLVVNYQLMYLYVRPIFNARKQVGFTAPMSHSYLSRY